VAFSAPGSPTPACPNCGAPAPGRDCPDCGQEQGPLRPTIREIAHDFVEEHVGWDSKIMRTIGLLVARPGALTQEYLAGRRVRYLRPLRLYLLTSVLFFVALSAVSRRASIDDDDDTTDARATAITSETGIGGTRIGATTGNGANLGFSVQRGGEGHAKTGAKPDAKTGGTTDATRGAKTGRETTTLREIGDSSWIERRFKAQARKISELPSKERGPAVLAKAVEQMPKALFLLVPAMAMLLRLLYVRSGVHLAQHLVFALHAQSALFLLALLVAGLTMLPRVGVLLQVVAVPYAAGYVYLAMRRVYAQSRARTALKFLVLVAAYGVALTIAVVLLALVAMLMF
jgi:hypothetical protein